MKLTGTGYDEDFYITINTKYKKNEKVRVAILKKENNYNFQADFYFVDEFNNIIGKIFIESHSYICNIIDNHAIKKNYGYGTVFMNFVLDYIQKHWENVKEVRGSLVKQDLEYIDYLPIYYEKMGFEVKLNEDELSGSIIKKL